MDRDIYLKVIEKIKAIGQIISGAVKDVKIDGNTIVEDGVANIPFASTTNHGVLKPSGSSIYVNPSGVATIYQPSSNEVKAQTLKYTSLTLTHLHEGAFYGLASAAGDETQKESSNPVGTYTENAMDAILAMLGVSSLVGRREASATPSANIAQNEAFIYHGKLYKATAAISTADTITPSTNCTETNLLSLIGG